MPMGPPVGRAALIRGAVILGAGAAIVAVVLRSRRPLAAAAASLRTSSSPGARAYDTMFSRLLVGLYDRMADDALALVAEVAEPRVLEVGLGPGELAIRVAGRRPDLRLVGLDVDAGMLRLARDRVARGGLGERVDLVEGEVEALPFEDATFHLVLSSFSVHHWSDPPAGMREILRVLRPGGAGVLYDLPDAWARFETHTPGLAAAARAAGVADPPVTSLRWPGSVALVRRLELRRGA
jgi:ubiquinone/menaquinone biosynthesis C-methylase UbiE